MRLLSLKLTRYGSFADETMTFDAAPGRINLLCAPNGAGKSVLRQAFGDLLFGIHAQSPMGFRFGYAGMRIDAEAVGPDGSRFGFARRKGQRNTLLDGDGQADTIGRLAGLLGPADRDLLERLFALDTERLRKGGEALLETGGAVGDALLAAAGLRGAKALCQSLTAEADSLAPAKRSAQRPFYRALDALAEARKRANQAVLRPDDWGRREADLTEAERRQAQHNQAAATAAREINQLQRLRRVRAPLAARDAAAEWLAAHPDAPVLAASLEPKLADAIAKTGLATRQVDDATNRHAEFVKEREGVSTDPDILAAAEAIERLGDQAGAVAKAMIDIPPRQADYNAIAARVQAQLRRLNCDLPVERAAALIPHRAAETRARALIARYGAVAAAVDQAPAALTASRQDIAETVTALTALPVIEGAETLAPLVTEIRAGGDPRALAEEAARTVEAGRAALAATLANLAGWQGDITGLLQLAVLPAETYERLNQTRQTAGGEFSLATARKKEAAQRTRQAHARLAKVISGEVVADAVAVAEARRHRDHGWQLIYRLAFGGDVPTPSEMSAFHADQPLPLAYQSAVQAADALADRRTLQADLIAQAAEARRALAEAEQAERESESAAITAADRMASEDRAWLEACANLPLAALPTLAEVRGFLLARAQVIDRQRDLARDEQALLRLSEHQAGWAQRLRDAMAPAAIPTLVGLLIEAEARLSAASRTQQQRIGLDAKLRELERRRAAAEVARAEAQARLETWQAEWATALAELGRPPGESPEVTADILAALSELDQDVREAARLDQRLGDMTADNRNFTASVVVLLQTAAPDLAMAEPDATKALAALRIVRERLGEQKQRLARREELQKFVDQTARQISQMRHRLTQSQGELLAVLSAIDAKTVEAAEERLAASRARAAQQSALAEAESRLREEGDGLSIEQLRVELIEVPADEIAARLLAAEAAMQAANADAQVAVAQATELRGQMAQLAGDISYESAVADQHAAIASLDRVLEEALLARLAAGLLQRAMAAVEAQGGSALLGRISRYFRRLSGGAYERIVTEDNAAGGLDLAMVPTDLPHEQKKVDQLSEGTRDQLYLALRMAAIEDHVANAPPLPFIGDDILQTSDDARATAALHALLELSQHVQVILLTHHPHIIQLASALPAGAVHVCEISR